MKDILTEAEKWIAADPDPSTRAELERLIAEEDFAELEKRFSGTLSFGTAGIRGEVGAGPARMNRAVVIRTTSGLATYLLGRGDGAGSVVVVGFDARPTSKTFAEDTVGVLIAAGFEVSYFPEVTPTPLVAFAAKRLGAVAAVVITASHNPPADNGYKVYDSNAAQIIPPVDVDIARTIETSPAANEVQRVPDVFSMGHSALTVLGDEMFEDYWAEVNASRPEPSPSSMRVVYSAMHGVGGKFVEEVFLRAGHSGLVSVPAQFQPDGAFPTVAFPNPEEEGALDLSLELATAESAELVIANDPDADRLAAVVADSGDWRPLSGNEIGVLLADFVLRNHSGTVRPMVMNSIVSSPMLGQIAEAYGAYHETTLTGFKWIVNAGLELESRGVGEFVFGYEEALGYTVGSTVRDKDGISAALVFTDLAAGLAANGASVLNRLEELWKKHGLWVSAQHSVVKKGTEGASAILRAVDHLGSSPPSSVNGRSVSGVTDFRVGEENRPRWLGAQALIQLDLEDGSRVLVRPSGTEPKLKIYVDLRGALEGDPRVAHRDLLAEAVHTTKSVAGRLRFD